MATDITFGLDIPEVDVNKIESGALGNTSNSTSAVAPEVSQSFGSANATVDTPTVVDTEQLETASSSAISLPEAFEPERISVAESTPPVAQEVVEASQPGQVRSEELRNLDKLERENKDLLEDLEGGFDSLSSIGRFESDLSDNVELQRKKEAKTEIDNKILKKNREFDLALRDNQDTFGTRAQKNAKKAEITKNFNRQLADLSIIQMARAGEYNDARAFVDEKVRLELQDRENNLNKLMFFYSENKERLTLADQRVFQQQIVKEEREYQEEYAKRKQLEDIKATMTINAAEDGAGNAQLQAIQNANSLESLMGLPNAGRWSKSKADRLDEQLTQLNIAKTSQALNRVANELVSSQGISPITGKAYTDSQAKAGTFAVRMQQAETELMAGKGRFLPFVPDFAKSADRRQFEQAERNFITAQLRRESGAAIADSEFEDARRIYIPLATDDEKTLQQKAAARQAALQGMKNESVGAFDELQSSLSTPVDSGSVGGYVDLVEQQLNDPYANILSGLQTSTAPVR